MNEQLGDNGYQYEKLGFFDSVYARVLTLGLDYGGLVASIGAGVAVGDHTAISGESVPDVFFDESMQDLRNNFVRYGVLGFAVGPSSSFIAERRFDVQSSYGGFQIGRNMFAGIAAFFITETYQRPSTSGIITSAVLASLAAVVHYASRLQKRELDTIVAEANSFPLTQD